MEKSNPITSNSCYLCDPEVVMISPKYLNIFPNKNISQYLLSSRLFVTENKKDDTKKINFNIFSAIVKVKVKVIL